MVESGEEVISELPVEVVQRLRTVATALQTKCEMVCNRAREVRVPGEQEIFSRDKVKTDICTRVTVIRYKTKYTICIYHFWSKGLSHCSRQSSSSL